MAINLPENGRISRDMKITLLHNPDRNLETLDYLTSGAGIFANVDVDNKLAKSHVGDGGTDVGEMSMMFRYRTGMKDIKIWVRREGAANALIMTLSLDGVADSTINGSSIIATADATWEEKTLTIGSTYADGDHLEIEISSTVDFIEANAIAGIWIKESE